MDFKIVLVVFLAGAAACVESAPEFGATTDAGVSDGGPTSDGSVFADMTSGVADSGTRDTGANGCEGAVNCWGAPTLTPDSSTLSFGADSPAETVLLPVVSCDGPTVEYTEPKVVEASIQGNRVVVSPFNSQFGRTSVRVGCGDDFAVLTAYVFPVPDGLKGDVVVWLNPDQGVELDENGRVLRWENLTPDGGEFVPVVPENPPTWEAVVNGVDFSGASPLVSDNVPGEFSIGPMFVAATIASMPSQQPMMLMDWSATDQTGDLGLFLPSTRDASRIGYQFTGFEYAELDPGLVANVPRAYAFEWFYNSSRLELYTRAWVDGNEGDQVSGRIDNEFGNLQLAMQSIGGESTGWNGTIHEVFVLTDTNANLMDTGALNDYFGRKYPAPD